MEHRWVWPPNRKQPKHRGEGKTSLLQLSWRSQWRGMQASMEISLLGRRIRRLCLTRSVEFCQGWGCL